MYKMLAFDETANADLLIAGFLTDGVESVPVITITLFVSVLDESGSFLDRPHTAVADVFNKFWRIQQRKNKLRIGCGV
jgi:hypothetical protein